MQRFGDHGSKARELTAVTDRNGAPYFIKAQEAIKKHTMDIEKYMDEFEDKFEDWMFVTASDIREHYRTTLTAVAEEARREERERIVEWYNSQIESDGELTSAPSGKEVITFIAK